MMKAPLNVILFLVAWRNGRTLSTSSHSSKQQRKMMAGDGAGTSIIIRRYDPSTDTQQVHSVFASGMESLIPIAHMKVVASPLVLMPLAAWTSLLGIIVRRLAMQQHKHVSLPLLLATSSTVLAVSILIPVVGIYRVVRNGLRAYIRSSIESDLSNIDTVYGGKGCFLVAEDVRNGKIVGTVGGQHIKDETSDDEDSETAAVERKVAKDGGTIHF